MSVKTNKNKSKPNDEEPDGLKAIETQIKDYVQKHKQLKRLNQDNIEAVTSFIEEYLQTFVLIGYNYKGDLVTYTGVKSQFEMDAINTGLHRYLVNSSIRTQSPPQPPE